MAKIKPKARLDLSQLAKRIVDGATGQTETHACDKPHVSKRSSQAAY
jgi:hypothetical protein